MDHKKTQTTLMAALFGVLCASPAAAATSVPGHASLYALPSCADVSLTQRCRVDLINGDFEGAPGDGYSHGAFSWSVTRPMTHSMRRHIAPWKVFSQGETPYLDKPALQGYVTLRGARDSIYQEFVLTSGRYVDAVFTAHAHVSSEGGAARAAIHLLIDTDPEDTVTTTYVETSTTGQPRKELVASLTVPANTVASGLTVAVSAVDGAPIRVDDVFLIRTPVGDPLPELVPAW